MAGGKPVVCLDLGGPGLHVDEDCGIKIPAVNPGQATRDLAAALECLGCEEALPLAMGRAARQRAEGQYHYDRLGERLLEIYQTSLGDAPPQKTSPDQANDR